MSIKNAIWLPLAAHLATAENSIFFDVKTAADVSIASGTQIFTDLEVTDGATLEFSFAATVATDLGIIEID